MKKQTKKLSLEKLTISKLNNTNTISGGTGFTSFTIGTNPNYTTTLSAAPPTDNTEGRLSLIHI